MASMVHGTTSDSSSPAPANSDYRALPSLDRLLGAALAAQTDEVFQDTWLRVVQSRERWAPQGATFRTWLYTLAHHRVIVGNHDTVGADSAAIGNRQHAVTLDPDR